nr:hypothetical protein 6 [Saccharospirillaceae bacterium]
MGRYAGAVQAALNMGGNVAAIDFTNWDDPSGTFVNDGLASGKQNAVPIGNPIRTTEGVQLNGLNQSIKCQLNDVSTAIRTVMLIYRPIDATQTGYLFHMAQSEFDTSLTVRSRIYGGHEVYGDIGGSGDQAGDGSIIDGAINHVTLSEAGTYSALYYGEVPERNYHGINGNAVSLNPPWLSIGSTLSGTSHTNIEVLFFAAWSDYHAGTGLDPILTTYNHYGRLLLPTNLDSTRHQSVMTLGPNREVTSRGFVFTGQTDLDIGLAVESGQPVEFFAFDTDADNAVLTTGPVVPDPQNPLQFEAVQGSGDGDGSGQARIAGTVQIDGAAAQRDVVVISDDPNGRQVVGEITSESDGSFDITYPGWTGPVIALALDTYGAEWSAETTLTAGAVIHPTSPNGYVYQVTTGGTTGTTEPAWPTDGTVQDGGVTFQAKPYYRPEASGPVQSQIL